MWRVSSSFSLHQINCLLFDISNFQCRIRSMYCSALLIRNVVHQILVNESMTPKQSLVTCYCSTCQKDTPHASSAHYTLSPTQQIVTFFRNTALSEFDAPVSVHDIAQFSSSCDPRRSFELAAGMIRYASTPKTRHFCSFRSASMDSWLYRDDSAAFLINSSQLEQTVPYVLFYISTSTTN